MGKMSVTQITHPNYNATITEWFKWRLTYEGGRRFIDEYLKQFSAREDPEEFKLRKAYSYNPAFAKEALQEVKNAICQRMCDVARVGGSPTYNRATAGLQGGVDRKGSSMDHYMSAFIIPELLSMKKVGVYVDMPPIEGETLLDAYNKTPYVYFYRAEDIRCWTDTGEVEGDYQSILLSEHVYEYDTETGFPIGMVEQFRHIWRDLDETGKPVVRVRIYKHSGGVQPNVTVDGEQVVEYTLNLPTLPFIVLELPHSLLEDTADYQIALLNLASSDIHYSYKSNFPFYTEQYDPRMSGSPFIRQGTSEPQYDSNGNEITQDAAAGPTQDVTVGTTHGRQYPINTERPKFIHPSSEPMKASMEKQEQLKEEIRLLTHLAVQNLKSGQTSSAESKEVDERGLENGLSFIGSVLQRAEQRIAELWAYYEGTRTSATVIYPDNYSLRSPSDRRTEAKELIEIMPSLPSQTFQKTVGKKAAAILLGSDVQAETLDKINKEIDNASNMVSDPEIIATDVENGLVDPETASQLRGYPKGVVEKAKAAQAERAAAIVQAQASVQNNTAARGVPDLDTNHKKSASLEKKNSRDKTLTTDLKTKVRGEGK